ncbi:MAG: 3-hydroxyacyl-CoA dehydrogenase [Pseudomonadota bacterium]
MALRAEKVTVVGSGLIGQAWAVVFARAGFAVALYDAVDGVAAKAVGSVRDRLRELAGAGLIETDELDRIEARVTAEASLEAALAETAYVQENGPENLEVKGRLTAEIDHLAPLGVPVGSSTSGIPASLYSAEVAGRRRCLVVHPINPPHLIPAVEIVPAPWTDPAVTDRATEIMQQAGQSTIRLEREIEGFVVNRLQGALLEEAFRLLAAGIAAPRDIDNAVSDGLGLRWALMGPFETIHLNAPEGVAQYVERYGPMYHALFGQGQDPEAWPRAVAAGLEDALCEKHPKEAIAAAQDGRDRRLMALLKHRRESDGA